MSRRSLRMRFLSACALLVAVLAACGALSVVTFTRLCVVIAETLRDSQERSVYGGFIRCETGEEGRGTRFVIQPALDEARREV